MKTRKKVFSKEFKEEAVKMVKQGGKSWTQVARELGIAETTLYNWQKSVQVHQKEAFPGSGRLHGQEEEIRRLRRENERLRNERDILKKAATIFLRQPERNTSSSMDWGRDRFRLMEGDGDA